MLLQSTWRDLYITVVHSCLFSLVYWWILFCYDSESQVYFCLVVARDSRLSLPFLVSCLKIRINVVDKQIFPHLHVWRERRKMFWNGVDLLPLGKPLLTLLSFWLPIDMLLTHQTNLQPNIDKQTNFEDQMAQDTKWN